MHYIAVFLLLLGYIHDLTTLMNIGCGIIGGIGVGNIICWYLESTKKNDLLNKVEAELNELEIKLKERRNEKANPAHVDADGML